MVVLPFDCFGNLSSQRRGYHLVRLHGERRCGRIGSHLWPDLDYELGIAGVKGKSQALDQFRSAFCGFNDRFQRLGGSILAKLPLVPKVEDSSRVTAHRRLSSFSDPAAALDLCDARTK